MLGIEQIEQLAATQVSRVASNITLIMASN
jgi:hypothetical protein